VTIERFMLARVVAAAVVPRSAAIFFRKNALLIMPGCPHFIELGGTSVSG
jgi:hypothetical protein